MSVISTTVGDTIAGLGPLLQFFTESTWARQRLEPGICDFVVGNHHEPVVPGFAEALAKWSAPRNKGWFAYKLSEPEACEIVAASLREQLGLPFEPADVAMTNGAFAGLAVAMRAVAAPQTPDLYLL